MSEEKKTHKRKLLTRYLILAACILVIAAITVTTVFAVNDWFRSDIKIDSGVTNPNDPDTPDTPDVPDDPNKPDEPNKPTASDNTFAAPVSTVNVSYGYEFGKDATLGHYRFHTGIDMTADAGTSVIACLDGTVESIVLNHELDGNTVTLTHANGLKTVYSFIDVKSGLKKGDTVKRGDVIGAIAQPVGSEYLQGAHLHFAVLKNGEFADPEDYLTGSEK